MKINFLILSILYCLVFASQALAQAGYSSGSVSQQRRQAHTNQIPEAKDVVVEEYMNFHRHNIPLPARNQKVNMDLRWGNADHKPDFPEAILQVGFTTSLLENNKQIAPLNIALVMDCSGSMADANRIPNVRMALTALVKQLRPQDIVSLIGFHDSSEIFFPAQMIESKNEILRKIEMIRPIGSTNIHAGLMAGYEEVMKNIDKKDKKNYTHRVLLLTDGMANAGITDPAQIVKASRKYNEKGIALSTIGVGDGVQTDMLRTLAEAGRGQVHFVGDNEDMTKVFISELQSLLSPVAQNPEITLTYDTDKLELMEFFGYAKNQMQAGKITLPLDDMNKGLTQILMIGFKPKNTKNKKIEVQATLKYIDAETKKQMEIHEKIYLYSSPKEEIITTSNEKDMYVARYEMLKQQSSNQFKDDEVRRNYVITRLAQSIKDLALLNQRNNENDKNTSLSLAQNSMELCKNLVPDYQKDEDVKRVYDILEKYVKML